MSTVSKESVRSSSTRVRLGLVKARADFVHDHVHSSGSLTSLAEAVLVFGQGKMFLDVRQEGFLDKLGHWWEEHDQPEAFCLVGLFPIVQKQYDEAPLPLCQNDDGIEGEVDYLNEKMDTGSLLHSMQTPFPDLCIPCIPSISPTCRIDHKIDLCV